MLQSAVCVYVRETVWSWGLWAQVCVNPSSFRGTPAHPWGKEPSWCMAARHVPKFVICALGLVAEMVQSLVLNVCLCGDAVSSSTACLHRHLQQKWACLSPLTLLHTCTSHPRTCKCWHGEEDNAGPYRHVFHIASHVSYHLCRLMQCNQQFNMLLLNMLIILFLSDTAITRFLCFDAESSKTLN